jgi:SAM-dependent methyltransferase
MPKIYSTPTDPDDVQVGLPLLLNLIYVVILASILRAVDFALLLRWPSLWRAHMRVYLSGWQQTPYDETSFDRVMAAKRATVRTKELTYGETPVVTARRLLKRAGVQPGEAVLDLGAGRGRVLLAALSLGARARGVELLEGNVAAVRDALGGVGADVVQGDAKATALEEADLVFITWSCFSPKSREAVGRNLQALRAGARLITVTWPHPDPAFELVHSQLAFFSWGLAPVYLYRRRPNPLPPEIAP